MRNFSYENGSACNFIFPQIKVILIRMVSHLDSLWNWGATEGTRKWPIVINLISNSDLPRSTIKWSEIWVRDQVQLVKWLGPCSVVWNSIFLLTFLNYQLVRLLTVESIMFVFCSVYQVHLIWYTLNVRGHFLTVSGLIQVSAWYRQSQLLVYRWGISEIR